MPQGRSLLVGRNPQLRRRSGSATESDVVFAALILPNIVDCIAAPNSHGSQKAPPDELLLLLIYGGSGGWLVKIIGISVASAAAMISSSH